MKRLLNMISYEYRMAVTRFGFWLAVILVSIPIMLSMVFELYVAEEGVAPSQIALRDAALLSHWLNLLMPVVVGISLADRMIRDRQLGLRELQGSTRLSIGEYVLAKYIGALLAGVTPVLLMLLLGSTVRVIRGEPAVMIPGTLLTFIGINLPAYAFITAFSLACPLIMPLRVYQVLFTGYWFWGNFLNPDVFPTLNGTLLTPNGFRVAQAFFNTYLWANPDMSQAPTKPEALLNVAVILTCAVGALVVTGRYLAWESQRI